MAHSSGGVCDDEQCWGQVGTGLNCLSRELHPYVEDQLRDFYNALPR